MTSDVARGSDVILVYSALELRWKSEEAIDTPDSCSQTSVFLMQAGFARASRYSVSVQPPAIFYTFPVVQNSRARHYVSREELEKVGKQ